MSMLMSRFVRRRTTGSSSEKRKSRNQDRTFWSNGIHHRKVQAGRIISFAILCPCAHLPILFLRHQRCQYHISKPPKVLARIECCSVQLHYHFTSLAPAVHSSLRSHFRWPIVSISFHFASSFHFISPLQVRHRSQSRSVVKEQDRGQYFFQCGFALNRAIVRAFPLT